jgi:hypothetical protein
MVSSRFRSRSLTATALVFCFHAHLHPLTFRRKRDLLSIGIDWLQPSHEWPGLVCIGKLIHSRESTADGSRATPALAARGRHLPALQCKHCDASTDDLIRRVAAFEADVKADPCVLADRLWVSRITSIRRRRNYGS